MEEEIKNVPEIEEEEESDFADAPRKEKVVEEETPAEEKIKEEKIEDDVEEEEIPEEGEEEPLPDDSGDEDIKRIDDARIEFHNTYRKYSRIKMGITIGMLLLLIPGWLIPVVLKLQAALWIGLGVAGVVFVGIIIYNTLFKRKADGWIRTYFEKYYAAQYDFVAKGCGAKIESQDLKTKISEDEIKATNLYKDIYRVSSRYSVNYDYEGLSCRIIDAAIQKLGQRSLEPAFIGKVLTAPNKYEGSGIYIYFKGNDRAIPPNAVSDYKVIEKNRKFIVYGEASEKKFLTNEIKNLLLGIRTNAVLVDVAISIQPGKTYFMLGYEDSLMVIPMDSKFQVGPTSQFKLDFAKFNNLAKAINSRK